MNANAAIRAAIGIHINCQGGLGHVRLSSNVLVLNDWRIYYEHDPAIGVSYLEALHKAQADTGALIARGAYRSPLMGGVQRCSSWACSCLFLLGLRCRS